MIPAATGHRPDKLGGYNGTVETRLLMVASAWLSLRADGITHVIIGMAQGWDQAVARACINLHLRFHAYVPFEGQERLWPSAAQAAYHDLLWHAHKIVVCCEPGFAVWKMHNRNMRMVDACTDVLALWDGDRHGGTYNCVAYAEKRHRPIHNQWRDWEKL